MIGRLLALALLVALAPASGAQSGTTHTFQILDGAVYLNGRHLRDAVPEQLDLAGMDTGLLEYSGPVAPVITVDGQAYVLQEERLVPLASADQNVLVLGSGTMGAPPGLEAQATSIVETEYMQEVASRNQALFEKMQRVRRMEYAALQLAARARSLPEGDERSGLVEDLRGRLCDILTIKHEIQAEEIALAQEQLDLLRARLDERESQHDRIVETRLRELAER
jgi:hypothetical protein